MSDGDIDPNQTAASLDDAIADALREPDLVIAFTVTLPVCGMETGLRQRLVAAALRDFSDQMARGWNDRFDRVAGSTKAGAATIAWRADVPKKHHNLLRAMGLPESDRPAMAPDARSSEVIADERASRGNTTSGRRHE